jgi:hypothetical protein
VHGGQRWSWTTAAWDEARESHINLLRPTAEAETPGQRLAPAIWPGDLLIPSQKPLAKALRLCRGERPCPGPNNKARMAPMGTAKKISV